MVICKAKVVKNEIVTGGDYHPHPIEIWTTFEIDELKIEAFMGLPRVDPEVGKIYDVNFKFMAYDLHQINIEEKMLKQISTFPMDPIYIVVGEVKEAGEIKSEVYRGKKTKTRIIKVDCGLLLDSKVDGWIAEQIKVGDYVAIIGKMFGEIVGDNGRSEGKE